MASISKALLLAADASPSLLPMLRSEPELVHAHDANGYTLLHALASYNHLDLLRELVNAFHGDPNIRDNDGETPLFVVETVEAAKCLVDELAADLTTKNEDGSTAEEKIAEEQDYPEVAAWLRARRLAGDQGHSGQAGLSSTATSTGGSAGSTGRPPPLPKGVTMNFTTVDEAEAGGEVDEEFRKRIEDLASREDFRSEESQRQLRTLITDAVRDAGTDGREVRRRVE